MTTRLALKRAYQVFTWVTLVCLIVTILLVLRKSPAPSVPNDPKAAARATEKLMAADQAKAAGQPARVELDRSELNSYLAQNLQLAGDPPDTGNAAAPRSPKDPQPGPPSGSDPMATLTEAGDPTMAEVQSSVKDVKVDMEGDMVKAYVVFNFHGKDLSLELNGHLRADNGYLRFDPVSGAIVSMPLPHSALLASVKQLMESDENREKLRLPPDISDLQIENGQAVVTYK
jgi:hypothetical protein